MNDIPDKKRTDDGDGSRIPGFYRLDIDNRLEELVDRGFLDEADIDDLHSGGLDDETADQMVENAVGTFELPLGLGLNFRINERDYAVPMAIEEPSVIAAVSHAAKRVRRAGGFESNCDHSLMIGQIRVLDCDDPEAAEQSVFDARDRILATANEAHPKMVERGGGARDVDVRLLDREGGGPAFVVHLIVDVCDAMGANLVNTMVERVAPLVRKRTGGDVSLRILSNLADRRLARARCRIPTEQLGWKDFSGREVAKGVARASEFAEIDPYRAATHNKGIMNGMGAVCVATGNDWRALEAGAHAYCAQDGEYGPLATWHLDSDGALVGQLTAPVQVGTVGGPVGLHPTVDVAHRILDVSGADELGEVIAAVGLAQNLSALKALATEGIQEGHMALHARNVAATAGAADHEIDEVVARLTTAGDVKLSRARNILADMRSD